MAMRITTKMMQNTSLRNLNINTDRKSSPISLPQEKRFQGRQMIR